MTRLDGRSILAKVDKLYESLINLYDMDRDISHEDIEDLITGMFGYSDRRTYKRYFKTLERCFYLRPAPKAYPISPRATVTKQKVKGGTLDHHIYRGEQYCWSHYRLGQVPLRPCSPRTPLQRSFSEWGVQDGEIKDETGLEKICVRSSIGSINQNVPLQRENIQGTTVPTIPQHHEMEAKETEIEERSLFPSHILSNKLDLPSNKLDDELDKDLLHRMDTMSQLGVNGYIHLLKHGAITHD